MYISKTDTYIILTLRTVPFNKIIEWDIRSQGCSITKFRNQFNSEVPVDSTKEVQLSDHQNNEQKAFSVFEAIIESASRK